MLIIESILKRGGNMMSTFESISAYLKSHSILTLATVGGDGKPALATVDYMWTGESLFFFTDRRSRKATHLTRSPEIVAIVAEQNAEFFAAKAVEVNGQVTECTDTAKIGAYMMNFMSRRPQFASLPPDPDKQANMVVYEVKPTKLRMLDNSIAPGHIAEVILK